MLSKLRFRSSIASSQLMLATGWQRDLSISYGLIGDVRMLQDKFADALKSYRDEFDVKDRLLKAAPDNIGRQRDIAVAHSHLGDAYTKQGDNKHAIDNYRLALAIMEGLASIDPKNQHWLAVLVEYNYDLAINGDDPARRFAYVAAALQKLQAVRKLTTEQAGWLARAKQGVVAEAKPR
jgi:tetratricopeptide (TPR) repeat protein